jgi:hypothetical protein
MHDSISYTKIFAAMFSFFFVGCAAAMLRIYRAAKNAERPPFCVTKELDGDIFV